MCAIVYLQIRTEGNSKQTSPNSVGPLWSQKKDLSATLQMLLRLVL